MSKPEVAQKSPFKTSVEAGRKYFWCACGRSAKQPFCDGSHKGTGLEPVGYQAAESGDVYFCGCKHTANKPFCDGTHSSI